MTLSTAINQLGTRYAVKYSGVPLHVWRVYDLYHSDIRNQHDVDIDVPDESEAVVLLTEDACVELVRARMHEGLLEVPSIVGQYEDNDKVQQLETSLEDTTTALENANRMLTEVTRELAETKQAVERKPHMSRDKLLDTFVLLAEKDQLRDDVVEALTRLA